MKQKLLIFLLILSTSALMADTYYEAPFEPLSAEVTAQGSSFTAVAEGYNALFTNPAGFATTMGPKEGKKGELTLLSANMEAILRPDQEAQELVDAAAAGDTDALMDSMSILTDQISTNGIGSAFTGGLAYVGRGIGIGFFGNADLYAYGKTLLGTQLQGNVNQGAVLGYSLKLPLSEGMRILVGADAKVLQRTSLSVPVTGFLPTGGDDEESADPFDQRMGSGTGFGLDAGVMLEAGDLTLGLSARDIMTSYSFEEVSVMETVLGDYGLANVTDSTAVEGNTKWASSENEFVTPMVLRLGAAYHPQMGGLNHLLDPKVHVEYKIPTAELGELKDMPKFASSDSSLYTNLNIGGELNILHIFSLRGGYAGGWMSAGAGLKLLFLETNISVYTREMGLYAGTRGQTRVAMEAAIRF